MKRRPLAKCGAESAETLPLVMPGLLFRVPFRHDTSEHNSKARPILKYR